MPRFSRPRVFLSGLIAGIVVASIQYLFDSFAFSDRWVAVATALTTALNDTAEPAPTFPVSDAMVIALLQVVGVLAGMLAARFYAVRSLGEGASAAKAAGYSWMLTYGVVCVALVLISRAADNPAEPPMRAIHVIGFAACGLLACTAGASLGGWVYRQSELAAAESARA